MNWRKHRSPTVQIDAILQPILALGRLDLIGDLRQDLVASGVAEAVKRGNTPAFFDWMLGQAQLQGISDANALGFTARHGAFGWADLRDQFGSVAITRPPSSSFRCPRLSSYWRFFGCAYEKTARRCAEPGRIDRCPLPHLPLRNGRLSQGAVALFLFVRDVCEGDLIGWIDDRLAEAAYNADALGRPIRSSPGDTAGGHAPPVAIQPCQQASASAGMQFKPEHERPPWTALAGPEQSIDLACGDQPEPTCPAGPNRADPTVRASVMREALLGPMSEIFGVGRKVLSMILADLLLAADPSRSRWIETGASMIAIDTLVHNFLHRTGILRQFAGNHPYGNRCYEPNGCAEIIERIALGIDARHYNTAFPATFPRYVQHAIWSFCAASGLNVCNGNRIDDNAACRQRTCPAFEACERLSLHDAR